MITIIDGDGDTWAKSASDGLFRPPGLPLSLGRDFDYIDRHYGVEMVTGPEVSPDQAASLEPPAAVWLVVSRDRNDRLAVIEARASKESAGGLVSRLRGADTGFAYGYEILPLPVVS